MFVTKKGALLVEWWAALLEYRQVNMLVLLQVSLMVAGWVIFLADEKVETTVAETAVSTADESGVTTVAC